MGGIEGHLNLLATRLVERGHSVKVLVSNNKNRLQRSRYSGVYVTKIPQLGRFFSAPVNYSLPNWVKRLGHDVDLLHFHLPNPTATLAYQFSGLRKPYIITYHADITRQKFLKRFYEPTLTPFLKSAAKIIATSTNYVRTSRTLRRFQAKCSVIPIGIDSTRFKQTREMTADIKRIRSFHNQPIILFLGKFRHYKGLPTLVLAMKNVNAALLLIGSGPLEARLRRLVREAGVHEKVFFLGALPDESVAAYLRACDIFILPASHRSEAFGIVLLEAMACGKPIVSTELGTGTSFVNRHLETGIVVPPRDVVALSAAINNLIISPERRKLYGRNGRARFNQLFGVEQMVLRTESLYQSVI